MKFNMKEFDRIRDKATQSIAICVELMSGKTPTEVSKELKCTRQLCEYYYNRLTNE